MSPYWALYYCKCQKADKFNFIKFLPLYNKVFAATGLGKSNFKDQYGPGTYYTKLWRSGILAVVDCMSSL